MIPRTDRGKEMSGKTKFAASEKAEHVTVSRHKITSKAVLHSLLFSPPFCRCAAQSILRAATEITCIRTALVHQFIYNFMNFQHTSIANRLLVVRNQHHHQHLHFSSRYYCNLPVSVLHFSNPSFCS